MDLECGLEKVEKLGRIGEAFSGRLEESVVFVWCHLLRKGIVTKAFGPHHCSFISKKAQVAGPRAWGPGTASKWHACHYFYLLPSWWTLLMDHDTVSCHPLNIVLHASLQGWNLHQNLLCSPESVIIWWWRERQYFTTGGLLKPQCVGWTTHPIKSPNFQPALFRVGSVYSLRKKNSNKSCGSRSNSKNDSGGRWLNGHTDNL